MWVWHGRVMDRVIVAVGLALCALVYMGGTYAEESGQRLVETTYTVQTGDTLWSVSEAYLKKNTGGRRRCESRMRGWPQRCGGCRMRRMTRRRI